MSEKVKIQMQEHPILREYGVHLGPEIVNLSVVSFICCRCNAIYCPIWRMSRSPEPFMRIDMVKRILQDLKGFPRPPVLRLLPHGELVEYPWIPELADVVKPYADRFPIVANTNGLYLDRLEPLLPILTMLEVSINANHEKEYRALRTAAQPGDFQRLVQQTKAIADRVRKGELRLKLVVSFLRYPGINDQGWEIFQQTWANLGAEPILRDYHSFSGHVPPPPNQPSGPLPLCKSLLTRMTIASDGSFLRCYNDIKRTDVIGKVGPNTTLSDLWYSEENLRGMLIMLGERQGRIFCSDCRDRVCADPRTGVGRGKGFEWYAREHHARIFGGK